MKRESARAVATRLVERHLFDKWTSICDGDADSLKRAIAREIRKARDDGRGGRR